MIENERGTVHFDHVYAHLLDHESLFPKYTQEEQKKLTEMSAKFGEMKSYVLVGNKSVDESTHLAVQDRKPNFSLTTRNILQCKC